MTFDEITAALKGSDDIPKAALAASVAHAGDLAPLVFDLADAFCRGTYLLPGENDFLFFGLQSLATARQPGLCAKVLEIARQPTQDIEGLFPDYITTGLARLLLSSWDRDGADLLDLIEHGGMEHQAKWALYDVLARLTYDGRIPRETTVAFLARIERDGLIDGADMTWWGWEQAVVALGVDRVRAGLATRLDQTEQSDAMGNRPGRNARRIATQCQGDRRTWHFPGGGHPGH